MVVVERMGVQVQMLGEAENVCVAGDGAAVRDGVEVVERWVEGGGEADGGRGWRWTWGSALGEPVLGVRVIPCSWIVSRLPPTLTIGQ